MSEDRAAWLATTREDAIEPGLPICDPHHHLWDTARSRYLLEELHEDTGSGHNVVQTVFLECSSEYRRDGPVSMQPVGETEFVASIAAKSETAPGATIAGIVGYADLRLGDAVADVLAAHIEAGNGRFRGIRHASAWDANDAIQNAHTHPAKHMFYAEAFRSGAAVLQRMGMSFDAWLYHPQISELVDLARAFPELSIVLDHLGGPLGIGPYAGQRDNVREVWRPPMRELAACPNVALKLGGIGMSAYGLGWHKRETAPSSAELVDAWGDDVRWCIDLFGPERCMFESNFPVDKRGCSYVVLWNAFKRIASGYSDAEKASLFRDSAARFYRL
jgi:predicted TIM-barrel fold metal-dependent hydrolase